MPNGPKTSITGHFLTTYGSQFGAGSAMFSPGTPPLPEQQRPVRRIDFQSGYNLNYTPRAFDGENFPQLRALANLELVRLAIETRKDQIERLEWSIKPKRGTRAATMREDSRMAKVERLFRKPDGVTPFASWLRPLVDDLLAIDAPAIEIRRNGHGDLVALDVIDGATIKVLVDENGRRPRPPAPAYQQVIKGHIWTDLTADDLIYAPRNMRSNHVYGFSPVQQIIVTINTSLRRQAQQLAYFTEGNRPEGIINGPDSWTPDQFREFQSFWDSVLSGNQAERSKLIWTPAGSKYQSFKDSPIKDDFDEWLARVVCFAFSLPPTPFIKQMNRSTAQEDQDRSLEEGLLPLLKWWKRLADGVIERMGIHDLEFVWDTIVDLDPKKQAEIDEILVRSGIKTINEVRDAHGLDKVNGGDEPMIYTATGPVPIGAVREASTSKKDVV